jgi:hypothetical protein
VKCSVITIFMFFVQITRNEFMQLTWCPSDRLSSILEFMTFTVDKTEVLLSKSEVHRVHTRNKHDPHKSIPSPTVH